MSDELVISFTYPDEAGPLSMNDHDPRGRRAKLWRERAYWAWCEAHPGQGPNGRAFTHPAEIHTTIIFTQHRRRDPINFAKTVKHIVDGFVQAGAWPDDTPDYVTQHQPTLTVSNTPHGLIICRITT